MKAIEIIRYNLINGTETEKVNSLVKNMESNGWTGMPILVNAETEELVTGSHRLAAIKIIYDKYNAGEYDDDVEIEELLNNVDVAEDVSEIIDAYAERMMKEVGYFDGIEYDNLRQVFSGTWVEQYANEIVEW